MLSSNSKPFRPVRNTFPDKCCLTRRMIRTLLAISLLSMTSLHALSQLESNLPSRHQSSQITQNADGSQTATVSTDTDTPLLNAILTINEEYGWNVHFEDAPTVNASEVFDYFPEFHRTHPG